MPGLLYRRQKVMLGITLDNFVFHYVQELHRLVTTKSFFEGYLACLLLYRMSDLKISLG